MRNDLEIKILFFHLILRLRNPLPVKDDRKKGQKSVEEQRQNVTPNPKSLATLPPTPSIIKEKSPLTVSANQQGPEHVQGNLNADKVKKVRRPRRNKSDSASFKLNKQGQ